MADAERRIRDPLDLLRRARRSGHLGVARKDTYLGKEKWRQYSDAIVTLGLGRVTRRDRDEVLVAGPPIEGVDETTLGRARHPTPDAGRD